MAPAWVAAPAFAGAPVGRFTASPSCPTASSRGVCRVPSARRAAACPPSPRRRAAARMMAAGDSGGPSSSSSSPSAGSDPSSSSGGPEPSADPSEQHDVPQSAVDWNAEWSRYAATGYAPTGAPKGRAPMTPAEKAARRVKNTAVETQSKVANAVPPWSSLKGDWRFWLAIIGGISLIGAGLNAVAMQAGGAGVGTV